MGDIVNKCNKIYHSTIKMKPDDVNASTYIDPSIKNNDKDSGFKVDYHVRISKYKKFSQKVTIQIGQNNFL